MIKFIYQLISICIHCIFISLFFLIIVSKCLGYTPYIVLSSSMQPLYPVGSLVYIISCEQEEIAIGDNITFTLDENIIVTHQVVEIDENLYYTKGIANQTRDNEAIPYESILGKVCYCIPYLGYISKFITSSSGLFLLISIIISWMIVLCVLDAYKKNK